MGENIRFPPSFPLIVETIGIPRSLDNPANAYVDVCEQNNDLAELRVFVMPPERKPRIENWRAAIVRLPAPPQAGIYQVTLSDEAWVDVVQNGGYARSIGSSGRSDCPGLRKTIRFEIASSPIALQISGASIEAISVVVGPTR